MTRALVFDGCQAIALSPVDLSAGRSLNLSLEFDVLELSLIHGLTYEVLVLIAGPVREHVVTCSVRVFGFRGVDLIDEGISFEPISHTGFEFLPSRVRFVPLRNVLHEFKFMGVHRLSNTESR